MGRHGEISAIYAAGVIQGLALVTFPAIGAVLMSPQGFGLSATEYGSMFMPQAVLAIASSLLGAWLRRRLSAKCIYVIGLSANLVAMALLATSRFEMHEHAVAYGMLLTATASMGVGFGFTVPALTSYAAGFFPQGMDKAVLALNALLGLGTVLAPVLVVLFVKLGVWWGLPVLVGALLLGLMTFSAPLPLRDAANGGNAQARRGTIPARFWVFALFALLYGMCETMNGNWSAIYMTRHFGAGATMASLALAAFWLVVTGGRVLFATIDRWCPERHVFRVLPLVVLLALIACAIAPKADPLGGILVFGLAGFGCSALLPLTMSFSQRELLTMASSGAGGLIAFYQIGYGLAAFGVGPVETWTALSVSDIFGLMSVIAGAMWLMAFAVTRRQATAPASDRTI